MPAVSESQRKLMCIALSMKRGETPYDYSKEAARLARTMSEDQLEEFCRKTKGRRVT